MSDGITTDSVMFFDNGKLVKEILYPEFEAILDNVVGLNDFKNRSISAAFVRITASLKVSAVVCFLVDFDAEGYVDKSWNLPLIHLAENAGRGPDMGAGPIKLSCRSQCSVSWHQRSLWDPDVDSKVGTFEQISKAASRNRLGLTVITEPVVSQKAASTGQSGKHDTKSEKDIKARLLKNFRQEYKTRRLALLKEQKLRIATMKSEAQGHIEKLQKQYQLDLAKLTETLNSTKQLFSEEKHRNLQLKKTLQNQADEHHDVRIDFQREIENGKEIEQSQLLALEEKFELEAKASIDVATAELKEMLDMREVELFYRDEQVGRLNEDVSLLRQEKKALIDRSGDKMLQKLVDKGISFVAYQPGVDHLIIPLSDISEYLDSPTDYVSEKCSVDKDLYVQWLKHYELPVCNQSLANGAVCASPIHKIAKPSRFISGESDRCARHSQSSATLSNLMSVRRFS